MRDGEKRVFQQLSQNGGVITRAEAVALGISPATLTRRVRDGYLVKVASGLYVQPGVLDSERTLLRAATSALNAVASHESAARLHGLEGTRTDIVSVSVPVRRSNKFADVVVHQSTDLTADETVEILGLPVTDPARTILDLAAVLPDRILARVADQSVRMHLTSYSSLAERLESTARRGKPGVVKLRRLLEFRADGFFVSDSHLETRLFGILDRAGLPLPQTQFRPPWLRHVDGRVDLAYPVERVLIEGDSRKWHGAPEAFQLDRQRDNLAQLAGWVVLRFTWEDITKRPSYVVDTVRHALTKRRSDQY